MSWHRQLLRVGLAAGVAWPALLVAQNPGPIQPPPPGKEVKRVPLGKSTELPPVPVAEIIRKFSSQESEARRAHLRASFRQTVRIQEYDENGEAGGEYVVIHQVTPSAEGVRAAKVVSETPSTLRRVQLSSDDLDDLARLTGFALTAENLDKYDVVYAGKQQVDELMTYAFRVRPKKLERRTRYFEGVVWVDDHDLVIVRTFGDWVTDVPPGEDILFTTFETFRDAVDGRLRFPIFTRSDDYIRTKRGEARLRLTIRYEEYKLP